jgi:hypothetical protein
MTDIQGLDHVPWMFATWTAHNTCCTQLTNTEQQLGGETDKAALRTGKRWRRPGTARFQASTAASATPGSFGYVHQDLEDQLFGDGANAASPRRNGLALFF